MNTTRAQKLTSEETRELLQRLFPYTHPSDRALHEAVRKTNEWILRGDHVVYENVDLGHPELGDVRFFSFGSPAAQFEVETAEELPVRLPDGLGGGVNWRYTLKAVYEGGAL